MISYKTTNSASVEKWATLVVTFRMSNGVYMGYTYRVTKFGNLTWLVNRTVSGKTLASCKRSANKMLNKVYGCKLDNVVLEKRSLEDLHATHETFKAWAASLFE